MCCLQNIRLGLLYLSPKNIKELLIIMVIRIIPRLDIKGPNLVKGIHLEGLRILGKPDEFAKFYYEQGADELFYMDIVASLYQRNSLLDIIRKTSKEIFIPLTVGGGLRTLEDINAVLRAGADKVALNTAAIKNPQFIREASRRFGSSTIVLSVEAKKMPDGSYEAYVDCGREKTGVDVFTWVKEAVELGAGEILVTSIDQEGTGKGYDVGLTRKIAESVSIPVIAGGGAGRQEHVLDVIKNGKADGVSLASIFHYYYLEHGEKNYKDRQKNQENNPLSGICSKNISPIAVRDLKHYLNEQGIECRKCYMEI
jgi:imidazole glycerol-phosphate synthase subunit HisF